MKKLEEMTQPDFLSTAFGVVNLLDGTDRKIVLADFYETAARIQTGENTPEHVRSYSEAVKTL